MAAQDQKKLPPEVKKHSRRFAQEIEKVLEKCNEIQKRQLTLPLGDRDVDSKLIYHPDHCLFTKHRQDMFYAYFLGGSQKLSEYLYDAAYKMKTIDTSKFSWQYFLDDQDGPKQLPFLLNTIHPDVVLALISGSLSYRLQNDSRFSSIVNPSIQKKTYPGIYCLQHFDTGAADVGSSQVDPSRKKAKGRGFSSAQLKLLHDRTRWYEMSTAAANKYAKMVDEVFTAENKDDRMDYVKDPSARRYLRNDQHRDNLSTWRKTLRVQVLEKAAKVPTFNDDQWAWSPTTVGYGANCAGRSAQHLNNTNTSKLFGLLNAIIRVEFPAFKCEAYQILYITSSDQNNLGEAVISVLCSSYHDMGGTNAKRAGALGAGDQQTNTEANRKRNIQALFSKPYTSAFKFGLQYQELKTKEMEDFLGVKSRNQQKNEDGKEIDQLRSEVKVEAEDLDILDSILILKDINEHAVDVEEKLILRKQDEDEQEEIPSSP